MNQAQSPSPTPLEPVATVFSALCPPLERRHRRFSLWSISQAKAYLMEQTRQDARSALERDLLVHRWSASLGEVYLPLMELTGQACPV